MEEINIEKGIPIPDRRIMGNKWKHLLESMSEGDSIVVMHSERTAMMYNARKSKEWGITTRDLSPEGRIGYCRIWKIKKES